MLAALFVIYLFNGCTVVGLIGGSLEDHADHIEKNEITLKDQRIKLKRFGHGTVSDTYKGMIATGDRLAPGDTSAIALQPVFLQSFDQDYTIHLSYDRESVRGRIRGLRLPDELFFFHVIEESDGSFESIPLKAVASLEDSTGISYLVNDPELSLYLVVSNSGIPQALHLQSISNIKPRGLNTVVATTAIGLVVDIGIAISVSQSMNTMNIWGE